MIHRSYLFVPGNHPRKLEKVFDAGADAVIVDLEDAVAVSQKPIARPMVIKALQSPRTCRGYVRINALDTPFAFDDLSAVVTHGVDGIVVPKIESPQQLATAEWVIGALEAKCGLAPGTIDVLPIIETGRGIAAVRDIAKGANRVRRLSFGAGDYTRDMGMDWTRDEAECAHARAEIVLASRVAGLEPPIDTVWTRLQDADGLSASAQTVKAMGFQGKLCIHPARIAPVHAVFTPDAQAIDWARKVEAAFTKAEAEGSASIQVDGAFVDYPIVEQARATLARAQAAGVLDSA